MGMRSSFGNKNVQTRKLFRLSNSKPTAKGRNLARGRAPAFNLLLTLVLAQVRVTGNRRHTIGVTGH